MTEDKKECANPDCHNPLTKEQMGRDGKYCSKGCYGTIKKPRKKPEKERVPLGRKRLHLKAPKREGYVRRWINDKGDRIQLAQDGGYGFVRDPNIKVGEDPVRDRDEGLGTATVKTVGANLDGSPIKAFLMEIPKKFYEEDQAAKMKKLDDDEEAMLRDLKDGQYRPTDAQGRPLTEIKKVPLK